MSRPSDMSPAVFCSVTNEADLNMPNYTMNAREWSLLVLVSVIWGLSFFFIEIVLRELGSFTLVLYRIGIAALLVTLILYLKGGRLPFTFQAWSKFFILGMFNNFLPFALISWGQVSIDSGLASILNATTPMFSVVMTHFLTSDERMTPNRIFGLGLGIAGVALLVGPEALHGISANVLGQLAILGAAISYSCGAIFVRRLNDMSILVAMSGTLLAASMISLPAALLLEAPVKISMSMPTLGAVLGLSVLGTAFAYMLYFHIIRTAGATNTLLVTFMVPVTALLMGVVVLGESLSQYALLGMLVIFAGLIAVDGRVIRYFLSEKHRTD